MVKPNFFIVGAAKAGTTAICEYIVQHPDVYLSSVKEPNFFATKNGAFDNSYIGYNVPNDQAWINLTNSKTTLEDYEALFAKVTDQTAIGEGSTSYLYSPAAAGRIYDYNPNAKIIAILRNPIDRAYSQFLFRIRHNQEPERNFTHAINLEEQRIKESWGPPWHYKKRGLYYSQVKAFLDKFGSQQCQIYLFDELKTDSAGLMKKIFHYLDVDPDFCPDTAISHNPSGVPKSRLLSNFLEQLNDAQHPLRRAFRAWTPDVLRNKTKVAREKAKATLISQNLEKPVLLPETRAQLIPYFREDILQLQDLLERDLSAWLCS